MAIGSSTGSHGHVHLPRAVKRWRLLLRRGPHICAFKRCLMLGCWSSTRTLKRSLMLGRRANVANGTSLAVVILFLRFIAVLSRRSWWGLHLARRRSMSVHLSVPTLCSAPCGGGSVVALSTSCSGRRGVLAGFLFLFLAQLRLRRLFLGHGKGWEGIVLWHLGRGDRLN